MELIRLIVRGMSHGQMQVGSYVLLLEEESGQIKLPIIIASLEAQSIAVALEKNLQLSKSFTHDLFVNFVKAFHVRVKSVIIYKLADGIFSCCIVFQGKEEEKKIESRASDAIALAIRFEAPIYATKEVFEQAGICFEVVGSFGQEFTIVGDSLQKDQIQSQRERQDLQKMSSEDLKALLKRTIDCEHYEFAAHIQKELNNRNKK